jgi:hypothetical protein
VTDRQRSKTLRSLPPLGLANPLYTPALPLTLPRTHSLPASNAMPCHATLSCPRRPKITITHDKNTEANPPSRPRPRLAPPWQHFAAHHVRPRLISLPPTQEPVSRARHPHCRLSNTRRAPPYNTTISSHPAPHASTALPIPIANRTPISFPYPTPFSLSFSAQAPLAHSLHGPRQPLSA